MPTELVDLMELMDKGNSRPGFGVSIELKLRERAPTLAREHLRRIVPALASRHARAQETAIPTARCAALFPRSEPSGRRGHAGHRRRSLAGAALVRLRARHFPVVRRWLAADVVVAQSAHGPGSRAPTRVAQHEARVALGPLYRELRSRLPRGDARVWAGTRSGDVDLAGDGRRILSPARAR